MALMSGLMTLLGILVSDSRSGAAIEVKTDKLRRRTEKHNSPVERTYRMEQNVAVPRNDVDGMKERGFT